MSYNHISRGSEEEKIQYVVEMKELYASFFDGLEDMPKELANYLAERLRLSAKLSMAGNLTEH